MTAVVTEHMPLVSAAPNGIQKLRQLIIELAVRGKLVPQDPSDVCAQALLEQMDAERAQLLLQGRIRRVRQSSPIGQRDLPFEVPQSWRWIRLGDAGHDWGQVEPTADFTYIDVGAVDNLAGAITTPKVLAAADAPSRARKVVRSGTVIYSTIRPYLLNVAVIDEDFSPQPIASTAFAIIHPFCGMQANYLLWWLRSPTFVRYVESVQTGIAYPAINDAQFFNGLLPTPPVAEQNRIVAKVDELMALCDRLEAQQADAEAAHAQLVEALLASLTQARDAADFRASWQQLAEHFHTLFTTEGSVDALKQAVLQLGVVGRLVPQDLNDEPALQWLERRHSDMTAGKAYGVEAAQSDLGWSGFSLPAGWCWATFGEICQIKSDLVRPEDFLDSTQVAPDCIEKGTGRLMERRTVRQAGIRGPNNRFVAGQLLYSKIRPSLSKAVLVDFDGLCSADMYPINSYIDPRFQLSMMLSEMFLAQVRLAENRVKMPKLNQESLTSFIVPVPPIEEQRRIVARLGALLAVCDELKVNLARSRLHHEHLASVLVEQSVA